MSDHSNNNLALNAYLTFNGNCREAMTTYHQILGGELNIMDFASMPGETAPGTENLVMHANIVRENLVLMASDGMPDQPATVGNNISLSINCESRSQADEFFNKLANGGKITMPMENTFWGAYFGMVTDKFGINWMFNYDEPKA